ncbi:hypothetical protein HK100_006581 [Physocladia obscura]|uniref:Band 7 domain-containing protein n=1 Tax=Physocladia obscura TaxID=109957 RepID=A0AAD5X8Q6_9FUNG|nr:hypothetical protein HK100_006581 [Physocladia obscura]
MRYVIADPNQFLAVSGQGIRTVRVSKKALVWPTQRCVRFTALRLPHQINMDAISKDRVTFNMPCALTIGLDTESQADALGMYVANFVAGHSSQDAINAAVKANIVVIVQGAVNRFCPELPFQDIFEKRQQLAAKVGFLYYECNAWSLTSPPTQLANEIEQQLVQYGLRLFETNIQDIRPTGGKTLGYVNAHPDQFLAVTGNGIEDILIAKSHFKWPNQEVAVFSVEPITYEIDIEAMSQEKLAFYLPAVFTVSVDATSHDSLRLFARRFVGSDPSSIRQKMMVLIKGVAEGETRVLAASISIEELFQSRKAFQENVSGHIESELSKYGLKLENANIKELKDISGSEYFKYLRQKAHSAAINQSKVDVAEVDAKGTVGERERKLATEQTVARLDAETQAAKNVQTQAVVKSQAALDVLNAECNRQVLLAKLVTSNEVKIKETELQREVEKKRAEVNTERLRAENLAKTTVEAESIKLMATAKAFARQAEAEAELFVATKKAEAVKLTYKAQSEGLHEVLKAFDNPALAMQYLMLEKGLFQELAAQNAKAIQGLNPKISVWNTEGSSGSDSGKTLRDIFQTLPPLLATVTDQTSYVPPSWLQGGGQQAAIDVPPVAETAVTQIIDVLGMEACDNTATVKDKATTHTLLLAGIFVGGASVLVRCRMAYDAGSGVTLEIAARSLDAEVCERIVNSIV